MFPMLASSKTSYMCQSESLDTGDDQIEGLRDYLKSHEDESESGRQRR